MRCLSSVQFSSVAQSCLNFATPWIAARQASLSITNSRRSLRLTAIESVMPSSHLILCHPLLLLPPIPPSIRVFSNEVSKSQRQEVKYWFPGTGWGRGNGKLLLCIVGNYVYRILVLQDKKIYGYWFWWWLHNMNVFKYHQIIHLKW